MIFRGIKQVLNEFRKRLVDDTKVSAAECWSSQKVSNFVNDRLDGLMEIKENSSGHSVRFRNGLTVAFGIQTYSKSVSGNNNVAGPKIVFPEKFDELSSVIVTAFDNNQMNMTAFERTTESFVPRYRNVNSSTSATTHGCSWLAIGFVNKNSSGGVLKYSGFCLRKEVAA